MGIFDCTFAPQDNKHSRVTSSRSEAPPPRLYFAGSLREGGKKTQNFFVLGLSAGAPAAFDAAMTHMQQELPHQE
jgi:hypothetical protein